MAPILGIYASQISGHLFAPSGAYDSIATVTVGAGGASSIDFTSIPSTYQHLQIRSLSLQSSANQDIQMQFNADTGNNYSLHYLYGQGASALSASGANTPFIYVAFNAGDTTYPVASVVDILDYKDTNKYKTTRTLSGFDRNGPGGYIIFNSGNWRNTAAISSVKIYPSAGNFNQYTQFALYGIKGN